MEDRPLVTQFRLTFIRIITISILATAATYFFTAILFNSLEYRRIYPANYYENRIPEVERCIRKENTRLLSGEGEKRLKTAVGGEGMPYQVLDSKGDVLYGTNKEKIFSSKGQLYSSLNKTLRKQGHYIYTVPVIDDNGNIRGAVTLSYQLKPTYPNGNGGWIKAISIIVLVSPFVYIIGFTYIFSKSFAENINKPLTMLTEASRKIKQRDLDFDIDYHSNNELGRLCSAFREMKDELARSLFTQWKMEQERVEMVEALAHDLKSPLSVIRIYSEALLDNDAISDEKRDRYLAVVKENAERSSFLVQQMQYTSDQERQDTRLILTEIKPGEFLRKKVHEYEDQAKPKNIKITLQTQGDVKNSLIVDASRLGRILDNIVSNSLEYTPSDGRIDISLEVKESEAVYKICDTGCGFSKKDLDKALSRFYRGDQSRTSGGGHSGLGLYIARQLAGQLGGYVKIYNISSGGACVEFSHKKFNV